MAYFDVPNIRKFKFSAQDDIPTISFTATKKKSEIELTIICRNLTSWSLTNFLEDVGQSKISLNIGFPKYGFVCYAMRNIESTPVVENLMVMLNPNKGHDFLMTIGDLLWSCNPKFVNLCYDGDVKAVQCLYEKLVKAANHNCLYTTSILDLGFLQDLKEVNVEVFEESVMEWLPRKAFKDASEMLNYEPEQLRFKLTWVSVTPAHTVVNFIRHKIVNGFLISSIQGAY